MSHSNDPLDHFFKKNMPKAPLPPANEKSKILNAILDDLNRKSAPRKSFFSFFLNPALMGTFSLMIITGVIVVKTKIGKDLSPSHSISDQEKDELSGYFSDSLSALDENSEFSLDDSDISSDNSL